MIRRLSVVALCASFALPAAARGAWDAERGLGRSGVGVVERGGAHRGSSGARARSRSAADIDARFRKAWARADVTLTASRF